MRLTSPFFFAVLLTRMLFLLQSPVSAEPGKYYYVSVPPAGEEAYGCAEYRIWIPDGVKQVRGIIVHQHGSGRNGITFPYDVHWQELAKKWGCALLGTFYINTDGAVWAQIENGTERAFLAALGELGKQSNHPELPEAPWVLWGHSAGGSWIAGMFDKHPDRIIAMFYRSSASRSTSVAAPEIPMVMNPGVKEENDKQFGRIWTGSKELFGNRRKANGCVTWAPDPLTSHNCGNSRLFAIPYIDACLSARLPDKPGGKLKKMDQGKAWLGNPQTFEIAPAMDYTGDKLAASWLPDESVARKWQEYVKTGWVTDTTPPAKAPDSLTARVPNGSTVEIRWSAAADFESGIKTFNIYRDGEKVAEFIGPNDDYNKRGFQYANYGDDPIPEVFYIMPDSWIPTEMKYIDYRLTEGCAYRYEISTVNWSGLESARSKAKVVIVEP